MTTKSAINFRTTYVLFGVIAALLAGLAIYIWVSDDARPNPQGILLETFHNIGAKPDQITGLEIDRGSEKLVFARQKDGRWSLIQPIKARADSDLVEGIVQQLLLARREEKGVDIQENLGAHGLDNPTVKVTLRRGDRTATLSLGKVSVGGDRAVVYVLTSDQQKKAQATLRKSLTALFKDKAPDSADSAAHVRDLDDFRSRKLLGEGIRLEEAPTHVTGVKLTVGKQTVHLSRNNPDKVWRFESPAGFGDVETQRLDDKSLNPSKYQYLNALLNAILSIEVPSAKDFLTGERDLTKLGLDPSNPDALRIDLERNDAIASETLWLSRMSAKEGNKVYARYEGDDSIAQVNADRPDRLWNLVKDPSDLRDRTLVRLRPDRIDAIDVIQNGKKAFELRKIAGRWKVYAGDKASDANSGAINEMLQSVIQPFAIKGYPPPDAKLDSLGLDKPAAELAIWEDGILKAEKDDPKAKPKVRETPTTRILLGSSAKDGTVFVRRIQGAGQVDAKMPESLKTLAERGRLEYVALALKPFHPADVTKLVIPRGKDVYEIELAASGRWAIKTPESKKDKTPNTSKIASIIEMLSRMQPQKIVAESLIGEQLRPYGLHPEKAELKVALRVRGEMDDRVWYFGHPVEKTEFVHAKTNDSDVVFAVSKQFAEAIAADELVDPRLFAVTAAEVDGLKLKGWGDPTTAPLEIALTRKPGGLWSAAKGATEVNGQKAEQLLAIILSAQAATAVVEKGKPEEYHGLAFNQGALEFTIELNGGKKAVITFGNLVTKQSNLMYVLLNGEIFTIKPEPLLIEVKAKPAALR